MKKSLLILVCVSSVLLSSCIPLSWSRTKFTPEQLQEGMRQEEVVKKFGQPFKRDSRKLETGTEDVYYYKEAVDVPKSSYTYILTTILTFKNGIMTDMKQVESEPPGSVVKVSSSDIK